MVSNTGPLISALQSGRVHILRQFYDCIHVPASTLAEFERHGAGQEIEVLVEASFIVVHDDLTASEKEAAWSIAEEISRSPVSKDKEPAHHYPEAEAIVLMSRAGLEAAEMLVDELAAREAARRRGVAIVGFPGILIRACRQGLMTPREVREALQACQRQGTHYSAQFIQEIYGSLKRS